MNYVPNGIRPNVTQPILKIHVAVVAVVLLRKPNRRKTSTDSN